MTAPRSRRATARQQAPRGLWRGRVSKLVGGSVYVVIPRLSGREYGPVQVAAGPWATTTGPAGDGHTHATAPALAAGDRILVGFIEGNPDDVVVICRLS